MMKLPLWGSPQDNGEGKHKKKQVKLKIEERRDV